MITKAIEYSHISSTLRLNADFHLSEGVLYERLIRTKEYKTLEELTLDIFCGGRSKRIYVESKNGIPYLSNTDINSSSPLSNCNYTSKKYWNDNKSFLKEGMIVTGRVGQNTVGTFNYIGRDLNSTIGSDNIIRIINNGKVLNGYLFAFLSSKYGHHLSRRHISGNAQPFITENMLSGIPIPILSEKIQKDTNELVLQSSELRFKANAILLEAQQRVVELVNFKNSTSPTHIRIDSLKKSHQKRFESQYFLSEGKRIREHIEKLEFLFLKKITKRIFRPGIFKRHYVNVGTEFLGGSDIVKAIPSSDKKLSRAKTRHLDELKIEENQILVTCGGTIGYSVLVNSFMANKTASQHILRVEANNIKTGYLFAFMSSDLGFKAIQSFTYGSVIPQIEPHHLELLPIPIFEENIMDEIDQLIMQYKEMVSVAIKNEMEAIEIVEKEIEQWQK